MSWERRRNGRLFYYREFRRGRRVVKQYVGGGSVGEAAAKEDSERRAARMAMREAERNRRQAYDAVQQLLRRVCDEANAVFEAAMLADGYHRPGRKSWRRRRVREAKTEIRTKGTANEG